MKRRGLALFVCVSVLFIDICGMLSAIVHSILSVKKVRFKYPKCLPNPGKLYASSLGLEPHSDKLVTVLFLLPNVLLSAVPRRSCHRTCLGVLT